MPTSRFVLAVCLCGLVLFSVSASRAQDSPPSKKAESAKKPDPSLLTVGRIYDGSEFTSQSAPARWLPDGSGYTTLEKSGKTTAKDIVRHSPDSANKSVLVSAAQLTPDLETGPISIEGYEFSKDHSRVLVFTNSKRVWRRRTRGDYWVLDRSSNDLRKLGGGGPASTMMFAKFSPSADRVAYVRNRNIYVENISSGEIRKFTETPTDDVINGTFDWVYEEELGLRNGFRWSPDGKSIAFWQLNTESVRRFPLVNNAAGFYPEVMWFAYPKTGETNPICRLGVVNLRTRTTKFLSVPGDSRDHYIARMDWAGNSNEIVLQQLNRLQNRNAVMLTNVSQDKTRTMLTVRDDAWVDVRDEMHWVEDHSKFTFVSEHDGWRHIYLASRDGDGEQVKLLTDTKFDAVQLLEVDEEARLIYFIASPDNPTQRYLYAVGLDGTDLRRVTPADKPGTHGYSISPDGRFAVHSYSSFDVPSVTEIVELPSHKSVKSLATNEKLKATLAKVAREPVEFFRVDIGDGVELDGWCIKPPGFDKTKKYPLLIYVYGEPAGQTVLDRWGGSSYLWHQMMAQKGYVIMSFDNRGTPAPRGREWRKCVYRKVGDLHPQDQAAAARAVLKERPYLDSSRVGVWGWSGGGSSTLHAMFKFPDLYHTGISIAPVPNQRYYDTIYQERYMGLPRDNVEGYRKGSAMNFASGLKGNLLVIHGTGDDNCHYQTTELLINELIRHNKPFSMFAYPNRTHSIREGKNTTRHLREMMTKYFLDNLPAGAR
jgi:dipeptidyl-peptidase-4